MSASPTGRARVFRVLFALTLCFSFAANFTAQPALAANFGAACGDTIGLIAAINSANANNQATNVIDLAAGCLYQLTAPAGANGAGLPDITTNLTIDGHGSMIRRAAAAPAFGIFNVANTGHLTLQNVILTGGSTSGVNNGAAITYNGGRLILGPGAVIENNTGVDVGVVRGTGTLTVDGATFRGNKANNGAAIYAGGTAIITNSTFEGNATVANDGGAIFVADGGNFTIANSTFSGNHSVSTGGALVTTAGFPAAPPTVTIVNSTFYGNSAAAGGGAIYKFTGTVTVKNSVFENNAGFNCVAGVTSNGFNVSDDATCAGNAGDLINTNPLLAPLGDNGGPTPTHGLLLGSPAIDSGDPATCTAAPVSNVDQRGIARSQGAACDRGAFESTHISVVTNTNDSGSGSLRQAILDTNGNGTTGAPNAIYFDVAGGVVQTISPASDLPALARPVILDGLTQPGATCTAWPPILMIDLNNGNAQGAGISFASGVNGSIVRGLAIHGFATGIYFPNNNDNLVECNFIGTNAQGGTGVSPSGRGIVIQGGSNNTIGGRLDWQRNLISGNGVGAIALDGATGTNVLGNRIGTNTAGTAAVPNGGHTIAITAGAQATTIGSALPGAGNLISGNSGAGIVFIGGGGATLTQQNAVKGNLIGVAADGVTALGNGVGGIYITNGALTNAIGGTHPGEGNVIAYNAGPGVAVTDTAVDNAILSNPIYGNSGIGIDIGGDGVTYNHQGAIGGPNNYQNTPVLYSALSDGSTSTRVQGRLDGLFSTTYSVQYYASATCDPMGFGQGKQLVGTAQVTTDANGTTAIDQTFPTGLPEPWIVSATATDPAQNTSEFSWCIPVTATNTNWAAAQPITLNPAGQNMASGAAQGYITTPYGEKWYKFTVSPGAQVHVVLTGQPGTIITLHQDPHAFYNQLTSPGNVGALSADAGGGAFLPYASLPGDSTAYGGLPSGGLPGVSSLAAAFLPVSIYPPGGLPPSDFPPGGLPVSVYPPGGLPPSDFPPGGLPVSIYPPGGLPPGDFPPGGLPGGAVPSGSLPVSVYPPGGLPVGYAAGAYTGAASRSLMAVSMVPNATVQTIDRDTFDIDGDLYVRVVGIPNLTSPFSLSVTVTGGVCTPVAAIPANTPMFGSGAAPAAGTLTTLILTDWSRFPDPNGVSAAMTSLDAFRQRPEVNGKVLNFGDAAAYPRVAAANAQADTYQTCPAAKNIVASEIKGVVDAYRLANQAGGATTLQYIVIAGGSSVIPFIQQPDTAGLASEKEYVPPVAANTPSEAGIKSGRVQGDDGYGSAVSIDANNHNYMVPDLAVGRLVETAADVVTAITTYNNAKGVVTPHSALVTGYDFVGDSAATIKGEFEDGINAAPCTAGSAGCYSADSLIQHAGLPPTDPTAWTAGQLRSKLFAAGPNNTPGHDLLMLSGHFSAGNLIAADYSTLMAASEVMTQSVSMTNVVVMTLGCHGGYTLPSPDLLTGVSPDPDWAKAFLRRGAAGYIASTGYAYGSTDLQYWGESLFINLSRQLRTGSGPVALGKALVAAKKAYIAEWGTLDGYDEKTLIETNLYGLPMMKVNMPGQRLGVTTAPPIVSGAAAVTSGPGVAFGLRMGITNTQSTITVQTALVAHPVPLVDVTNGTAVNALYYSGRDGVVVPPFAPVFPKEGYNVAVAGSALRGVAFRGGTYADVPATPLTQVPSTELSNAHPAYHSDVFYPVQTWQPNYLDAVSGGPDRLSTVPAQYRSAGPATTNGAMRTYSNLSFYTYYMDAGWNGANSPTAIKNAGNASAPTINGISSTLNGSDVRFTVRVQGDPSAGVQAVWLLYTAKAGPLYGRWQPLDLAQWNATADPTLWQGTLTLPAGANPADLQFMVQAVSAAGLPSLDSNQGAYYTPALTDAAATPPPSLGTSLAWTSAPSSGTYFKPAAFGLRLTYTDTNKMAQPLANQPVYLNVGGQQTAGLTDANGNVTLPLQPYLAAGAYTAQATFAGVPSAGSGAPAYLAAASSPAAFTVAKDSTSLAITPAAQAVVPGSTATFTATLRDSAGNGLGGKSVVFVFGSGTSVVLVKATADYQGAARATVSLPAGRYPVAAYFGSSVTAGGETIDVTDAYYGASQATALLGVGNAPPSVGAITGPVDPVALGTSINTSAAFTDPDQSDTHSATWSWGDGSTSIGKIVEANGSGSVTGAHSYGSPGVFAITLTVTDEFGACGSSTFQYVVVYDPNGSFVTGGGWFNSPAGDYVPDPSLGGKASFGFNARYPKGSTTPAGSLDFSLGSGVSFGGTALNWLVTNSKTGQAQFQGAGALNGASGYSFLVSGIDGSVAGGPDKIRIKIWNAAGVVYDNQPGAADNAAPVMAVGGGNIKIH